MRKNDASLHGAVAMVKISPANIVKILKVELCWKPIMIACNENFPPIEPPHQAQASLGKGNVA
jgi:hypothetical protein